MSIPIVGVSACLLGQSVRYDGGTSYTFWVAEELKKYCRLIAVCPEIEIGLGVPREKIQLTQVGVSIKVLKKADNQVDLSKALQNFAEHFVKQYSLSGLVLKDKSPSCGINNTQLFSETGEKIGLGTGLFAETVMELLPNLPVLQASELQGVNDVEMFVAKIKDHHLKTFLS